jgi:hypothetical protein
MKWFVHVVGGLLLVSLPMAVVQWVTVTHASAARAAANPQGSMAHSAYGLQLSVPTSWKVAYFQNCAADAPGTLLIGTPLIYDNCTDFPPHPNIVSMQPEQSELWTKNSSDRSFVVHGLQVKSHSTGGQVSWAIVAKGVVVTAYGPKALSVLQTLTLATPKALAAPGMIKGTEYLETLTRVPVTGIISAIELDSHGPELQIHAYAGQFMDQLPPGKYRLMGHDGSAQCPTITTTVRAGEPADLPPINCQGM